MGGIYVRLIYNAKKRLSFNFCLFNLFKLSFLRPHTQLRKVFDEEDTMVSDLNDDDLNRRISLFNKTYQTPLVHSIV